MNFTNKCTTCPAACKSTCSSPHIRRLHLAAPAPLVTNPHHHILPVGTVQTCIPFRHHLYALHQRTHLVPNGLFVGSFLTLPPLPLPSSASPSPSCPGGDSNPKLAPMPRPARPAWEERIPTEPRPMARWALSPLLPAPSSAVEPRPRGRPWRDR